MARAIDWTAEQDDTLKAMWKLGSDTIEIAEATGRKKNAVIGRAHRLGLGQHLTFIKKETKRRERREKPKLIVMRHRVVPPIEEPTPLVIDSIGVPFMSIKDSQCHSVIGSGDDGLAQYCGNPVKEGSWCCGPHYRRYYYKPMRYR